MITKISKVNLHPASCKYLKLGHPWITEDTYTVRFPKNDFFLIGVDEKNRQEIALLINDPGHKNVKARLWSLNPEDWKNTPDFKAELEKRIKNSIELRISANLINERDNFYLINAESDFLPGLLVLKLKNQILIQYYALFWKNVETQLLEILQAQIKLLLPEFVMEDIWIQERNFNQAKSIRSINGKTHADFILNEFGINYQIRLNEHYDFGIYTDMSAIRMQMRPYLEKCQSMLNLFCYTGAFSLYALKLGAKNVVSVDLSSKYLNWLDENIALNPELNPDLHSSLCMPTEKALEKMISEQVKFDAIICDPPSASSDGSTTSSALKSYEKLLPLMLKLLAQNGSIFVFQNTHTISWNKFEEKLKQIVQTSEFANKINIGKRFKLSEDCLPLKGFHEGDYLKGFLIDFKNKGN
ncbi:MAG: class I SAM-dependent methyltransferase [Bacteriovorax sp.]|nr:class I SAM-dependent methyltransferase [Bacteriovorax sp.]